MKISQFDVQWHVPGRKSAVAGSTRASSDLIALLVEDGAATFRQVRGQINFDDEAVAVCDAMIARGFGDAPIRYDAASGGVAFVDA